MDIYLIIIWVVIFLGYFIYKKATKNAKFFEKQGVPFKKPLPFVGNSLRLLMKKENMIESLMDYYEKFKHSSVYGVFSMNVPFFVITDPELIKQITIKDFDSFVNHDKSFNEDVDKFSSKMLFTLIDEKWKHMRSVLSPIFTSSKMKMMFGILSECANEFVEHHEEKAKHGKVIVNCVETYPRYTVDGISTAVLGFKGDCIKNEDSKLYKLAMRMRKPTFLTNLKLMLFIVFRWLYIKLGLQLTLKEVYDFFYNAIIKVMNEREEKGIFRPDVVQLLLQARKGQLQKESDVNEKELSNFSANIEYDTGAQNRKITNWTDEHFMAQGFLFFAAGFDTTNILLQITSYCLAKNKEVQEELIREIDDVFEELDGKPITYEALHKMKYLDMVISEALRFWPPAFATTRQCNKDYDMKLKDGKVIKIKDGDLILLPIYAIHHDERFFPNPEKFDPLRFSDENKESIALGSYIPFGSGPRVCIGSRFALMEAKLLIFNVLSKFTMEVCDQTPEKLELIPSMTEITFKKAICVEYRPRKKNN
ncbi:hypothetical protein PVAND_000645 [Polypedilum vanderplanki]|uniref:Cytochrome P450 n=1 Tax=Polypedilum vanderplanki TaxID=319348 RepID=A0A9J6BL79_POLVA|nr:hypothetical protein PVAND_000645 [Polypedilum vanderplanki]